MKFRILMHSNADRHFYTVQRKFWFFWVDERYVDDFSDYPLKDAAINAPLTRLHVFDTIEEARNFVKSQLQESKGKKMFTTTVEYWDENGIRQREL